MLCKLGDSAGDCIIEAAIECPEFIDRNRRAGFMGQVCDGLTDIAVVPDDLLNGKPCAK